MKRILVRYKVKAEQAHENQRLVEQVYAELQCNAPTGLRYATFKQNDGVSFVHIASIETESGDSPLSELPAFKAFQAQIKDRCVEPPVAIDLEEIGSYDFWGK
ncbi:hypothetical protein BH10CHL1_BH10CHL1_30600 [soil metagenome]